MKTEKEIREFIDNMEQTLKRASEVGDWEDCVMAMWQLNALKWVLDNKKVEKP